MYFYNLFKRRDYATVVTVVFHTMRSSDIKRATGLLSKLRRRVGVLDAYIVYYGERTGVASSIPLHYPEELYSRGSALYDGGRLASSSIVVFIDAGSKCFTPDNVVDAVDSILTGEAITYMSAPSGSQGLFTGFKSITRELGGESTRLGLMSSPAYSIVVTLAKYVKRYSFWSIEPFIALNATNTSGKAIRVNNECIDLVDLGWLEPLIIADLRSRLVRYLQPVSEMGDGT
ncbi:hypothetical protein [Desulfurococcus amylolyticus]|uniref:Uncharacterized protein n=1 Tax=Desulfurococcus amylolyticus DSM 16532 TaxID=768672 RepID=I3XRD1_DESAM|nr:hypothetical protein [Desulfurococcus amylolyticus]AFL66505.1 hypothetical protein Desfe_0604 [Desulfurococcus amylolyticus DSM 16532]